MATPVHCSGSVSTSNSASSLSSSNINSVASPPPSPSANVQLPPYDIIEDATNYYIRLFLPFLDPCSKAIQNAIRIVDRYVELAQLPYLVVACLPGSMPNADLRTVKEPTVPRRYHGRIPLPEACTTSDCVIDCTQSGIIVTLRKIIVPKAAWRVSNFASTFVINSSAATSTSSSISSVNVPVSSVTASQVSSSTNVASFGGDTLAALLSQNSPLAQLQAPSLSLSPLPIQPYPPPPPTLSVMGPLQLPSPAPASEVKTALNNIPIPSTSSKRDQVPIAPPAVQNTRKRKARPRSPDSDTSSAPFSQEIRDQVGRMVTAQESCCCHQEISTMDASKLLKCDRCPRLWCSAHIQDPQLFPKSMSHKPEASGLVLYV